MLKRFLFVVFLCTAFALPAFGGVMADGQAGLPNHLTVNGADLRLNGSGKRSLLGIDAYLCALYLPRSGTELEPMLDPGMPKAISFRLLAAPMGNGLPDDLVRKLSEVMAEPRLTHLRDLFDGLNKGDDVVLAYAPDAGTTMWINGGDRGVVDGHGVMSVFLDHWLGEAPVSESLRAALLGLQR